MSESKFEKIALIIEKRIESGDYPPNFKLPTHKLLAAELETTPATVSKAYKCLIDKRKIESFVGRGTFVCGRSSLGAVIQPSDSRQEINLSILQPDLRENALGLSDAYEASAREISAELIGYTENSGHLRHRQTGLDWAKRYGFESGRIENTLLVDGAQNGLALAILALTKPGDTIAAEALTYPGLLAVASLYRRTVVAVDMDENGMVPDALQKVISESHPALVVVIPSHQNPTGITMPESRRRAIAKVIQSSSCWLLEDDIYGFLNHQPIPAISNWLPDQAIHLTSLSKAISPALRCGFLHAPDACLSTFQSHIRTNIWLSSPLNYAVASQLLDSGEAYVMAEHQRQIALRRQKIAKQWLPDNGIEARGFHFWLSLPESWGGERFVLEAKQRGVLVSSGSYFNVTGGSMPNIRISLMSVVDDDQLAQGLRVVAELLASDSNVLAPF